MPFDRQFAEALFSVMASEGWHSTLPEGTLTNPLDIIFRKQDRLLRLIIHARNLTRQAGSGENPSTHNRPIGEWHMQMIFDGDKRGPQQKLYLRTDEGAKTLLLGFCIIEGEFVVAAYDPNMHQQYGYSTSQQVSYESIEQAFVNGIAFYNRKNDETVVVFRLSEILQYLEYAHSFHDLATVVDTEEDASLETESIIVQRVLRPNIYSDQLPELLVEERKRTVVEVGRYIRNQQFTRAIKSIYERCAICGFQYDYILDAAHIVPVAEGGTDTYDNGLGLCPNCHRMFDKGYILVDETYKIYLNPRYAEEYDQLNLAGSLDNLRDTLRDFLWLPKDEQYHPSPENLQRAFLARR